MSERKEIVPMQTKKGEAELREDFGRLFPGQEWPGYEEAWRRVGALMRKLTLKGASAQPREREPGEDG
jgi:hypothetical protein